MLLIHSLTFSFDCATLASTSISTRKGIDGGGEEDQLSSKSFHDSSASSSGQYMTKAKNVSWQ